MTILNFFARVPNEKLIFALPSPQDGTHFRPQVAPGLSWAALGRSWCELGVSGGDLGVSLGSLGAILGRHWSPLPPLPALEKVPDFCA